MSLRDELQSKIAAFKDEIAYLEAYVDAGGNWFHDDIKAAHGRIASLFDGMFNVTPDPVIETAILTEPEPVAEPTISESPKE